MNIKSIAIEITDKAFLPESYAYREFFIKNGFQCDFVYKGSADIFKYDAVLLFHGFHPFWHKYPKFVIGEYHSLSTGRFSRIKDLIKRFVNVRADLYTFLNESVRRKMWFSNNINYITRGMGFNKEGLDNNLNENKFYDVVYCGSYRSGLKDELIRLAELGLSIALVGPEQSIKHENIVCFGRKSPEEARNIMLKAKYGLNYTPDVFPLNIQDSTKIIEYCALGLGVITNRYKWVNDFEEERNAAFLDIDKVFTKNDVLFFSFVIPDVSDLEWGKILERCMIIDRLS